MAQIINPSELSNDKLKLTVAMIPDMKIAVLGQVQMALVNGDTDYISKCEAGIQYLDALYVACETELDKRGVVEDALLGERNSSIEHPLSGYEEDGDA